ncbi:MAG: hypothetical protein GWM90_29320 [Gemmatimonadetes bacterium]|nr:hypothetical protein [Gemmatimonadota bacterium]NIQ59150.1 hypothetical protein [Gemmatimonadota bacterium]NIU79354.1 hypothetical protein [Gammaproteobacteria bacterium]NIX48022.1 hypothetical protein [Gemmatimonadota bacterium]NIY12393.1 hypothetical protein [Gemmatimonadota bacterium]
MTRTCAMTACAALLAASTAVAQETELEHTGTFPESFGLLQTVRPLPDGRVVVADPLGGVLAALDVARGTLDPIGREGGGPGEWRQPDAVYPLPGGSTLLVDLGNARLTVLDAAGAAVETHPMALSTGAGPVGLEIITPRGTDALGRVYFEARPRPGARGPDADSSRVKRWVPGTGSTETVAGLRPPAVRTTTSGGANDQRVSIRPIPLAPADDWAVAPDGRVAVVRAEPYRVEWIAPDGGVTRGPPVEHEPVPVGTAEKERWIDRLAEAGLSVGVTEENGVRTLQFRRGGGPRGPADLRQYEWPETLPAFRAGGAIVDGWGRVWVERYGPVNAPTVYDIFDRRGVRVRRVRLPAGQRVIGFGEDAIYAIRVDDLGLNWLELYRLPN